MDTGNRQAVPLIPVRQPRRHLPPRRSHRIPSYRLSPHESEAGGEEQEEESEGEGNNGGGIVCEEDEEGLLQPSVPPTSSQPNQQAPQGHFLDEEEEEITMRRTQPQATPHNIRMRRHHTNNHLCPRTKWRWRRKAWEATRGNQKHRDTLQVRKTVDTHFSHDKTPALLDPVWCLAGGCHHSFSGPRRGEHLRSHIHAVHRKQERMDITNEALISQGLVRCDACGEVCSASLRARQHIDHAVATTHVGRRTLRHSGRSTGRRLPDPTIPRRRRVWNGHPRGMADDTGHRPAARPVAAGKSATRRYLHKREWPNWLDVCRTVMLGYNASRRMNAAANRWPLWTWCDTTYDCRRNRVVVATPPATNHNKQHNTDPPIDHFNNTTVGVVPSDRRPRTTRRARSAMRRSNRTRRPTRQSAYLRGRHIQGETRRDTVHTAGNGTRSRAPHGGGGGAGGIFPRAGPKP
ncbi:putative SLACS retrotransposable element [Trypanosoma cruzi]|uniref:Putative SLACS retrotransposable element n=1 Tax=Trypanosoma cruzi TaxID=5693 RepID=A0A2V2VX29_TRYCR|nr:putative SLACS retrotransposable element [Trypanosoma cruzi]